MVIVEPTIASSAMHPHISGSLALSNSNAEERPKLHLFAWKAWELGGQAQFGETFACGSHTSGATLFVGQGRGCFIVIGSDVK